MTLARTQVAVVGGGILGSAILWALARAGLEACLIEKDQPAAGATGSSSGMVRAHYTNRAEAQLAHQSLSLFLNWADEIGGTAGLRRTGFLRIVGHEDVDRIRTNVAMLREIGVRVDLLAPDDVSVLEPALQLDGIGAAAYEPDAGYADPSLATASLLQAATRLGAALYHRTEALGIVREGQKATGVVTSRGTVRSEYVVIAAGAWSRDLLSGSGDDVPLRSRLIRAGLIRGLEVPLRKSVMDDSIGTYYRPEGADGIEFGLEYEWDVQPRQYPFPVAWRYLEEAAGHIEGRFLRAGSAGVVRGWGAVDAFTPDGLPVVGVTRNTENLYIAVGGNGAGFKTAPAIAVAMAGELSSGQLAPELAAFDAHRFDSPIRSVRNDYRRPGWRSGKPGALVDASTPDWASLHDPRRPMQQ